MSVSPSYSDISSRRNFGTLEIHKLRQCHQTLPTAGISCEGTYNVVIIPSDPESPKQGWLQLLQSSHHIACRHDVWTLFLRFSTHYTTKIFATLSMSGGFAASSSQTDGTLPWDSCAHILKFLTSYLRYLIQNSCLWIFQQLLSIAESVDDSIHHPWPHGKKLHLLPQEPNLWCDKVMDPPRSSHDLRCTGSIGIPFD